MGEHCEKFVILSWESIVWTVFPITFIILCLLLAFCAWIKLRHESEERDHYNVLCYKCDMMPNPELTLQHQECLACSGSKDIEEGFSTDAHEPFNMKGIPPDIFIINEKGKTIQYIMCV